MNNFDHLLKNLTEAKEPLADKITIEKYNGEYRIPAPDGYEDGAAYTDDKEDAISTAKTMYKNPDLKITFRSVSSFEGGKYEKFKPGSKLGKKKKLKESHWMGSSSLSKREEEQHEEGTYDNIKRLSGKHWDAVYNRAEELVSEKHITFNQALLKAYEDLVENKDTGITESLTGVQHFIKGFKDAALWAETDDADQPLDKNYTENDFAPQLVDAIEKECEQFYKDNQSLWAGEQTDEMAGHDFLLTRNGHGAGFWDGDYENGDELTAAAKKYKQLELYIGDDGLIYGSGYE